MSKRKGKVISDATAVKSRRVAAVGFGNAPDDTNHQRPFSSGSSRAATGDIGLIESITLKNFMCHHLLGPFQFGPNVNFIVGNNGSGKSAILTALIVGLGGKATVTNRGVSLKDFVKSGENTADITVKLRNRGPDAYKRDVYGDNISIEHRISCDGCRTCKLRSKSGRLISSKKEELTAILDHFNIQLDNPVSILNQEMSKQFLHSKSESDKYKFFMKATLLEQMKRDYIHIKHTKTVTRQQVERQEESLKDLKQEFLQKKERYEHLSSFSEMKVVLENLKKAMAWCLVREKEQLVQQLKEDIEKEENNCKHQDNLQLCQNKVVQVEKKLQCVKSRIDSLREEQESLSEANLKLREQVKVISRAHQEQELVYFRALNKLKQSEQEQNLLQEKINKARTSVSLSNDEETEYTKQQKAVSSLKEQLAELENKCSQLNQEIKNKHQAFFKAKEEQDKLRLEERNIQVLYTSKLKRKNQLLASRSNKLKRFGDHVPDLLGSIAEAYATGRFLKRPVGPIGAAHTTHTWMSGGGGPMMMPTSVYSASAPNSHVSQLSRYLSSHHNTPEEDDETMSTEEQESSVVHKPDSTPDPDGHRRHSPEHATFPDDSLFSRQRLDRWQEHKHNHVLPQPGPSYFSYQPPRSLPAGYGQPTPFPSQADSASFPSSWSGYPSSLPSCPSQKDFSSCSGDSCLSGCKSLSLPGRHSPSMSSLEQPLSLCSNPPSANLCHHTLPPYSCSPQGAACCAQRPADAFNRRPVANKHPWPQYHPAYGPYYPGDCRLPGAGYTQIGHNAPAKEKHPPYSTPLSLEQRRVFVTYEADNDKHVNEIINFVALLRHNGFDTHIDIFEQQFRSISKIDFMERYLSEKEYLIIIIISPKYYETVTASPVGLENDERTFNTVYIHKQLQNEFIQNGSKNFRFIPIVFPGAKKCHVPNWLQNTHVYGWPRDRDDILRRLMRVEKYNPPPIGELPTIVSIPI